MTTRTGDGTQAEFLRHQPWLLALARRLALDESEAQDLVQEAWSALLGRRAGTVRDLRAFLGGILRRRARRRRWDAAARRRREEAAAAGEALPSAAELAERLELARTVADELAALDEAQRTLLLLRHQEDLSAVEIARRRGVPAATVRSQLQRARAALRARLDRRVGGAGFAAFAFALQHGRDRLPEPKDAAPLALGPAVRIAVGLLAAAGIVTLALPPRKSTGASPGAGPAELVSTVAPGGAESASGSSGATPSAAREVRPSAGPVPGPPPPAEGVVQLVDAESGAALFGYVVALDDGTNEEEFLVADADGRLRLPAARFARALVLRAQEDETLSMPTQEARREDSEGVPDAAHPWTVAFHCGPTYRLLLPAGCPPLAELEVSLQGGTEEARGDWVHGTVRAALDGGLPWTRLAPDVAGTARLGAGPWTLTVRSSDGLWLGSGAVPAVDGAPWTPVRIEGGRRGVLEVAATVGAAPPPVQLGASVYPQDPAGTQTYVSLRTGVGRGRAPFLVPGSYFVWVGTTDFPAQRVDFEILPGETTRVAVDLAPAQPLVPLEVLLQSDSGQADLIAVSGIAWREGDGVPRRSTWVRDDADGRRLRFEALPEGTWRVEIVDPESRPWDAQEALVEVGPGAPREVAFRCLDAHASPLIEVAVQVVDAATGAPLSFANLTVYRGGSSRITSGTDAQGRGKVVRIEAGRRIGILVCADGHRPHFEERAVDATEQELVFRLERGWGTMLEAVEPSRTGHGTPVEGVLVRLDGLEIGRTDDHGRVLMEADAPPARVELEREGYRFDYGMLRADGTIVSSTLIPCWVLLRPEE